ncbi:hypothetical protein MWU52_03540 [Jannaschia sp. S6380]|uniref:hypothetical protein n=1 Tax=Jannaschia sp. S6380 TaxID=2926408 RepID=UPI001FF28F9B|nr:hypothetical protein [Jannaschia sp. S6380]MCK0166617.1 hypothetical protein [Jannaschia sp. S6380]
MPSHSIRRLPRGINFLLGGSVVAAGFILFAILGGSIDFRIGGTPDVRIDGPVATANAKR